jgi:NhaA family Na+:H+ antiporter
MSLSPSSSPQSKEPVPPGAWAPLLRFRRATGRSLDRFLHIQASSGILLLIATAIALVLTNSAAAEGYFAFWQTLVGFQVGSVTFARSLEWVVNDVLMVIFFFVVGLEMRREIHEGELSDWRRATLPVAAAVGGMVAPAAVYLALVGDQASLRVAWGVPMATDIAFAVGVLALLGKRVPAALRVLLLALAVIDDLGAIIVIALFYSSGLSLAGLAIACLGIAGVWLLQRAGVRSKLVYVLPGAVVWAGAYTAGVHPTIAGVILGLATPVQAWLGLAGFVEKARERLDHLGHASPEQMPSEAFKAELRQVNNARREALSPADSLIDLLHPWVVFVIMPTFALANAGVPLHIGGLDANAGLVALAVTVGLVVGKPAGILAAIWLTLRLRWSILPIGITWRHLLVLGLVAGIGFTMAIFIAQLALVDQELLTGAKMGVIAASLVAGVLGLGLGRLLLPSTITPEAAQTASEAERSTEK